MILPIPTPFNDTEYSISVVAVDTGGRYREPQGIEKFIADGNFKSNLCVLPLIVPLPVTNLMLTQSYDPDNDDSSTINIIVAWNEVSANYNNDNNNNFNSSLTPFIVLLC